MRNTKRFIALLLAGLLVSSPLSVYADELTGDDSTAVEETVVLEDAADVIEADNMEASFNTMGYTDPEVEYILENDPGVIWMPIEEEDTFITADDELGRDGISQIVDDSSYCWPNLRLNDEQRQYVIDRCKQIVAENITEDMSDLEKYWTLGMWIKNNVEYPEKDSVWFTDYTWDVERTPHGAHGALKYGYGVCQGQTLLYALLCHAADLPCDEIATFKKYNHIANFIPNVNGNSYYVDVTCNKFMASDNEDSAIGKRGDTYWDKNGKDIHCSDDSFMAMTVNGLIKPDFYNKNGPIINFNDWFHFYAQHNYDRINDYVIEYWESIEHRFETPYIEKGSGERGKHITHYADYALQSSENTGNWELDDFYYNPKLHVEEPKPEPEPEVKNIENVTVSGLKESYKCADKEEYLENITNDMSVAYDGTALKCDVDYELEIPYIYALFGWARINGKGDYTGSKDVKFNITQEVKPVEIKEKDVTVVAGGYFTDPDIVKEAIDGGAYKITLSNKNAVVNDKGIVQGKKVGTTVATINKADKIITLNITVINPTFGVKSYIKNAGDEFDLNFADGLTVSYSSNKPLVATVDENGHVTAHAKGSAKITAIVQNKKYGVTVKVYDPTVVAKTTVLFTDNKTVSLSVKNGCGKTQWSSSDTSVVIVNNGKIKGVSKGTATVTAINNGKEMPIEITVYTAPKFEQKLYTTTVGNPITVALTKDDDMDGVVYTVSNTKVADIDGNGVLTPKAKGNITVVAKVAGKTYKTKIKISN